VANLSLVFDLVGRDLSASKAFKDVGNSAERAGQQGEAFGGKLASGLKLAAGALLGAGLIEGFKSLYDAAAESAKIGRLTEQVIKSTGGAANVSAKQVGDLAAAIAKKTGIDDEAIQSSENLLLTFTNVSNEVGKGNNIFNQATGIITDMSVALGQDSSSSAIQLGKALNDPIKGVTALQRVGVSFTASQKEQIATLVESGKTMDAQKLILAELGKEFGGAAEAASTPFDKLKVNLGNLAETLGNNLIPYVNDFADFMSDTSCPRCRTSAASCPGLSVPLSAWRSICSRACSTRSAAWSGGSPTCRARSRLRPWRWARWRS
jgi:phage-related minor tail protein